jgi:hypothetical protein
MQEGDDAPSQGVPTGQSGVPLGQGLSIPPVAESVMEVATFALAPALAYNGIIDYSTREGQELYKTATAPLATKFDLKSHHLATFLEQVTDRSISQGWDDILTIPNDPLYPGMVSWSIIDQYGLATIERVQSHASTYIMTKSRMAQDSMALYQCLMASLTEEARRVVRLQKHQYTFRGIVSGPALLRLIIQLSHLDTRATETTIRYRLCDLDKYIVHVKSNIEEFNEYVNEQLSSLHARGATTLDLAANLLKAYKCAQDTEFVRYITNLEDMHNDTANEIYYDVLMVKALNKYHELRLNNRWMAGGDTDSRIIALEAKIQDYAKGPKTYSKGKSLKPNWMVTPPKPGQPLTIVKNEKQYHWCPKHNSWVRHSPAECRLEKPRGNSYAASTATTSNTADTTITSTDSSNKRSIVLSHHLANYAEVDPSIDF